MTILIKNQLQPLFGLFVNAIDTLCHDFWFIVIATTTNMVSAIAIKYL